jgi:hypothetical protein
MTSRLVNGSNDPRTGLVVLLMYSWAKSSPGSSVSSQPRRTLGPWTPTLQGRPRRTLPHQYLPRQFPLHRALLRRINLQRAISSKVSCTPPRPRSSPAGSRSSLRGSTERSLSLPLSKSLDRLRLPLEARLEELLLPPLPLSRARGEGRRSAGRDGSAGFGEVETARSTPSDFGIFERPELRPAGATFVLMHRLRTPKRGGGRDGLIGSTRLAGEFDVQSVCHPKRFLSCLL